MQERARIQQKRRPPTRKTLQHGAGQHNGLTNGTDSLDGPHPASTHSSQPDTAHINTNRQHDLFGNDDLFDLSNGTSKEEKTEDQPAKSWASNPSPVKESGSPSSTDDIFSSLSSKTSSSSQISAKQAEASEARQDEGDNLFNLPPTKAEVQAPKSVFDDDLDDLFTSSSLNKPKPKPVLDDDLFMSPGKQDLFLCS